MRTRCTETKPNVVRLAVRKGKERSVPCELFRPDATQDECEMTAADGGPTAKTQNNPHKRMTESPDILLVCCSNI